MSRERNQNQSRRTKSKHPAGYRCRGTPVSDLSSFYILRPLREVCVKTAPLPTATQFKPLRGSEPFPWTFSPPGVQPKIWVKISPSEGRGSPGSSARVRGVKVVAHLRRSDSAVLYGFQRRVPPWRINKKWVFIQAELAAEFELHKLCATLALLATIDKFTGRGPG